MIFLLYIFFSFLQVRLERESEPSGDCESAAEAASVGCAAGGLQHPPGQSRAVQVSQQRGQRVPESGALSRLWNHRLLTGSFIEKKVLSEVKML